MLPVPDEVGEMSRLILAMSRASFALSSPGHKAPQPGVGFSKHMTQLTQRVALRSSPSCWGKRVPPGGAKALDFSGEIALHLTARS